MPKRKYEVSDEEDKETEIPPDIQEIFNILERAKLLNLANKKIVLSLKHCSQAILSAIKVLAYAELLFQENFTLLCTPTENLDAIAAALNTFMDYEKQLELQFALMEFSYTILTQENFIALCTYAKHSKEIASIFVSLFKVGILTPKNRRLILDYEHLAPSLREKIEVLENAKNLTQDTFNQIMQFCRDKIVITFLMGINPRVGEKSTIWPFWGEVRKSTSDEKPQLPPHRHLADLNLLNEIFDFIPRISRS